MSVAAFDTLCVMCGRFTLSKHEAETLAHELGVPIESLSNYRPRYNIAPTNNHWIVRIKYEQRELLPARWGLVNRWAKDRRRAARQINARSETAHESKVYGDAFRKRRCIIPADGFFEWTGTKKARQPIWFHRADGGLILFAGLYESWHSGPEQQERTFTILTTGANDIVGKVHDRMPVILDDPHVDEWLFANDDESESLRSLLVPAAGDLLVATPVSTRANSVKNDDPSVLEEVEQVQLS